MVVVGSECVRERAIVVVGAAHGADGAAGMLVGVLTSSVCSKIDCESDWLVAGRRQCFLVLWQLWDKAGRNAGLVSVFSPPDTQHSSFHISLQLSVSHPFGSFDSLVPDQHNQLTRN